MKNLLCFTVSLLLLLTLFCASSAANKRKCAHALRRYLVAMCGANCAPSTDVIDAKACQQLSTSPEELFELCHC
ncbi:unnamed protein product [Caenorhabditis sp. 36 PRJEB53466]|nr:unnamed protein product [Caenorhabditis sp. 36 PRJEB53466]